MIENGFTTMPNSIRKNFVLDRNEASNLAFKVTGLIFELFNEYDPQFLRFADYKATTAEINEGVDDEKFATTLSLS